MFVRELTEGQEIEQALLVREREVRATPDGGELLKLTLADRTGAVPAVLAGGGEQGVCGPGAVVWVEGRCTVHLRHGARLELRSLRPARGRECDTAALLDGPPRSAAQMEADLRELLATVQNPHLRALLDRLLGPSAATWPEFRDAPAAKRYHQA